MVGGQDQAQGGEAGNTARDSCGKGLVGPMDGQSGVLGCGQTGGNRSAPKTLMPSTYSQDALISLVEVLTFLFGRQ